MKGEPIIIELPAGKKAYFISDLHFGVPTPEASREREFRFMQWMDSIRDDVGVLFILGDLFDFWFEYKHAIPKGFVRAQAKIAELSDSGVPIHFFTGNHDMWIFDYLPQELGMTLYREPRYFQISGTDFLVGHGDGLGPGDMGYKFIKKVFASRICQVMFSWIHPSAGIGLANYFSRKSRAKAGDTDEVFLGEENEWLIQYCQEVLQQEDYRHFIFGHRHLPIEHSFPNGSRYTNLGEWISQYRYGVYDGEEFELKKFDLQKQDAITTS